MPRPSRQAAAGGSTPDVDAFLAALTHPEMPAILALRDILRSLDPGVRETIKWNAPSYATTSDFATFQLRAKEGVQLVLHFGATPRPDSPARSRVADPTGLLTWKSADRALLTVRDAADVAARTSAIRAVLVQWMALVQDQ